jgi:aminopeptidase
MSDPRMVKLAETLVNYCVEVKPGDWVIIMGNVKSLPLSREVYRHVYLAGGNPNQVITSEDTAEITFKKAGEEQLQWISPFESMTYEKADVLISIRAASNAHALANVDPQKQQVYFAARREMMQVYKQRSASGELRWVITNFPCQAYAQDADMSLSEYEDFVYKATFADKDDPVAAWQKVHAEQQKLVDWLKGKKEVVVRSPNADLTLSIEGREFINSDGKHNMPSGEVFTSPIEDSANGWVQFTYPAIRLGREVEGVRLEFKDGKIVKASAEKNEEFLLSQLDVDEGARHLGEFAIGTNYGIDRFTKSILFDEKIGGTFHLAVGRGFPEVGGENVSAIHWDMICDARQDSEILVDGELFYKDGEFQVK